MKGLNTWIPHMKGVLCQVKPEADNIQIVAFCLSDTENATYLSLIAPSSHNTAFKPSFIREGLSILPVSSWISGHCKTR